MNFDFYTLMINCVLLQLLFELEKNATRTSLLLSCFLLYQMASGTERPYVVADL